MFECYIDKVIALSPNIDGLTKQLDSELIIKDNTSLPQKS